MKAAQIDNYGDSSAIVIRDVETPTITDDQVLVKVAAGSLNPFDSTVLSGGAQGMAPLSFPATLGIDIAGVVEEIGGNISGLAIGDRVYGTANAMFGASGAFAEFAAANAANIGLSPSNISDAEAAALPTAGISAYEAIVETMDLQPGQKLFINGGAGGIGSFAIQIAHAIGAHVTVTASAASKDFVLGLGADQFIDYRSQDFTDVVSEYDGVLNTAHVENPDDLLAVVKSGGTVVSLTGGLDEDRAKERGLTAVNQFTRVNHERLDGLRKFVDDGSVTVAVAKTFPLASIRDAYDYRQDSSVHGKVVIAIDA